MGLGDAITNVTTELATQVVTYDIPPLAKILILIGGFSILLSGLKKVFDGVSAVAYLIAIIRWGRGFRKKYNKPNHVVLKK